MRIVDIQDKIDHELLSHDQIMEKISEAAQQASEDYAGRVPLLVCVLKGAVSSYGSGTSTSGKVTVRQDLSTDVRGRDVLIVEDIVDSGVTLSWLVNELKRRGAASVEIFALLEKPARHQVQLDVKYKGFVIPDEFVVGFGLDFDEEYRNLDSIAVLKPEVYEGELA